MIVSCFDPSIGGGERHVDLLSREMVARGHKVTILTRAVGAEIPMPDGILTIRAQGRTKWSWSWNMLCWSIRNGRSVDVIHAHQSNSPLVVAAIAGRVLKIPVVCTVMSTWPELRWVGDSFRGFARRWLFKRVGLWLANNSDSRRVLSSYAPGKVASVCNGVDIEQFRPATSDRVGPPVVVFVGRLTIPKRVDWLLRAWQSVDDLGRLAIVGDGPMKETWRELALALGLKNVEFLGHRPDVPSILNEADAFALPSEREGMPYALLEAMACGLAVIASPVGAIPEILSSGNGLLADSQEEWRERLGLVLSDRVLRSRMGTAARDTVIRRFTIQKVVDEILDLYPRTERA